MAIQRIRSIRYAKNQHLSAAEAGDLRSEIRNWKARSAFGEAGTLAERVGCVFSKSRASPLEKGFKNATPAWFPKLFPVPPFSSVHIRSLPWLNQIKPS